MQEFPSYEVMKARQAYRLEGLPQAALRQEALAAHARPGLLQRLLALWHRAFVHTPVPALKKG
ncbi:MAG TPA: hypothetical protein VNT75_15415 [Symbiobacteriaceae bacterium]|nr:hypothetical protein [Symbiobacteriaceae bacterium]